MARLLLLLALVLLAATAAGALNSGIDTAAGLSHHRKLAADDVASSLSGSDASSSALSVHPTAVDPAPSISLPVPHGPIPPADVTEVTAPAELSHDIAPAPLLPGATLHEPTSTSTTTVQPVAYDSSDAPVIFTSTVHDVPTLVQLPADVSSSHPPAHDVTTMSLDSSSSLTAPVSTDSVPGSLTTGGADSSSVDDLAPIMSAHELPADPTTLSSSPNDDVSTAPVNGTLGTDGAAQNSTGAPLADGASSGNSTDAPVAPEGADNSTDAELGAANGNSTDEAPQPAAVDGNSTSNSTDALLPAEGPDNSTTNSTDSLVVTDGADNSTTNSTDIPVVTDGADNTTTNSTDLVPEAAPATSNDTATQDPSSVAADTPDTANVAHNTTAGVFQHLNANAPRPDGAAKSDHGPDDKGVKSGVTIGVAFIAVLVAAAVVVGGYTYLKKKQEHNVTGIYTKLDKDRDVEMASGYENGYSRGGEEPRRQQW